MERMTKEAMTIDHAVATARELLAALDQQLTAVSVSKCDEARDRVAALAFNLTAVLEQLSVCTPDNDVLPATRGRSPMHMHERYRAGPGRQLVVVQCFSRCFVAEGFVAAPYDGWCVEGPFDSVREARQYAQQRSAACTGWPARKVVEA